MSIAELIARLQGCERKVERLEQEAREREKRLRYLEQQAQEIRGNAG